MSRWSIVSAAAAGVVVTWALFASTDRGARVALAGAALVGHLAVCSAVRRRVPATPWRVPRWS